MRKLSSLALVVSSMMVIALWDDVAYSQGILFKDLSTDDDVTYQDTMINQSGSYDPCCNVLFWYDRFHRDDGTGMYTLRFHYNGTSVHHGYYAGDYDPGETVERSGSKFVGPSSNHELVQSKSNWQNGSFDQIYMSATYQNEGGSGPGGP